MAPNNSVTERVPGFAVFIGNLTRETVINRNGRVYFDYPGGDILYAASAYKACGGDAGLLSCTGRNFPQDFLNQIQKKGLDIGGVKKTNFNFEQRSFYFISEELEIQTPSPQKVFSEMGISLPKILLGFDPSRKNSIREDAASISAKSMVETPGHFKKANSVYLGSIECKVLKMATAYFRSSDHTQILVHPGKEMMHSGMFNETINSLGRASSVITSLRDLKSLFSDKSKSLDQIVQIISTYCVKYLIILMDSEKTFLYDFSDGKKYLIPMLPLTAIDPVGAASAFCGGYMAGINMHSDPVNAAALGNTMRSLKLGGSTPDYLLQTLPEFIRLKAEMIRERIIIC